MARTATATPRTRVMLSGFNVFVHHNEAGVISGIYAAGDYTEGTEHVRNNKKETAVLARRGLTFA